MAGPVCHIFKQMPGGKGRKWNAAPLVASAYTNAPLQRGRSLVVFFFRQITRERGAPRLGWAGVHACCRAATLTSMAAKSGALYDGDKKTFQVRLSWATLLGVDLGAVARKGAARQVESLLIGDSREVYHGALADCEGHRS